MGLTIHYTITPRQPIDATEDRRLIYAACAAPQRLVLRRGYSHVTRAQDADPDDIWRQGTILLKVDHYTTRGYSAPPKLGGYYALTLGQDCENAFFGHHVPHHRRKTPQALVAELTGTKSPGQAPKPTASASRPPPQVDLNPSRL